MQDKAEETDRAKKQAEREVVQYSGSQTWGRGPMCGPLRKSNKLGTLKKEMIFQYEDIHMAYIYAYIKTIQFQKYHMFSFSS
jgi:hypothetical protein